MRTQLEKGDIDGAMEICEKTSGPVADILHAGLRKFKLLTGLGRSPDVVESEVVKAMEDHGVHVVADQGVPDVDPQPFTDGNGVFEDCPGLAGQFFGGTFEGGFHGFSLGDPATDEVQCVG